MQYQQPDRPTGKLEDDFNALWETVWRLIEQLNIDSEIIHSDLERMKKK